MLPKTRYLITADPLASLHPDLDSTLRFAAELHRRGIAVDYCDLTEADWHWPTDKFLAEIPVRPVLGAQVGKRPPLILGERTLKSVAEYDAILARKDPPVNEDYRAFCGHFAQAPSHIVQINSPLSTWKYSEHLLPAEYPEYSIPTVLCRSVSEMEAAIRKFGGETVAKPISFFSGHGIEFLEARPAPARIERYFEKWGPEVILQPFISDVMTTGDLRILTMNAKIVGSVIRKPRPGSRLANLHQGGSAHAFTPTARQIEASIAVATNLLDKGLYLLGLDFIGDRLSEINITCPSAVPQINDVMGIRCEVQIIDEVERLISERRLR